jgi:uncharacterized GH25 family protein
MKLSKPFLLLFIVFFTVNAIAHEFWIAPSQFKVNSKQVFNFNCFVGEDFQPTVWANRKERTLKVRTFHNNSIKDITNAFVKVNDQPISMIINESGNHLIALESKASYIEMKAEAFNEYLKEDGMLNILDYRVNNHLDKKDSREFYQRCAKSLIQVDGKNDSSYKIHTGMALEIIPLSNPYLLGSDSLDVYFEFKGKPLSNYQVRTWCKKNGKLIVKSFHTTNKEGFAKLPIKQKGEWMISLVKMELVQQPSKADYESYWGSYTFIKE